MIIFFLKVLSNFAKKVCKNYKALQQDAKGLFYLKRGFLKD
jgi:hypothetical protein